MSTSESIGRFQGGIDPEFDSPQMRTWLAKLPDVPECEALSARCDQIRRVCAPGSVPSLALKKFTPPPLWKSELDDLFRRGSRARRAFDHARHLCVHGAPTPRPVAWLEAQEGSRIREQYLLTECLPNACTFRGALLHHYYENPHCEEIMNLLQAAARAVRTMHDSGFEHRDLGNQNIMVRRNENGQWQEAWIIDLHRGRIQM